MDRIPKLKEDKMSDDFSAQDIPGPETGENISPVEVRYETLGVEKTKRAYEELNSAYARSNPSEGRRI
jgi:hypothetical protein